MKDSLRERFHFLVCSLCPSSMLNVGGGESYEDPVV